jgi:hypothetical protein
MQKAAQWLEFGSAYRLEQLEQAYLFEKGLLVVVVLLL